jgi:hypothetical protein
VARKSVEVEILNEPGVAVAVAETNFKALLLSDAVVKEAF